MNVVGWISGLATAHVVTQLFEVKGFRNLWGLAASGRRALVTPDDYRLIMTLTGFTVGLLMMLVVRHLLMRWISETRALRAERIGCLTYGPEGGRRPTATEFDAHDVDHDS